MGIRESMNRNPAAASVTAAAVAVVAIAAIAWQVMGGRPSPGDQPLAYFTDDDGATFFEAEESRVPPFDHGGKQAVRAHVYECDGKRFVGYLERYTPEAAKALAAQRSRAAAAKQNTEPLTPEQRGAAERAARESANTLSPQMIAINGRELKRPGEKDWVRSSDFAKAAAVQDVKCPGDAAGTPEPVLP